MSLHFGQKSLTVLCLGTSAIPTGRHGCPLQSTLGHLPNSHVWTQELALSVSAASIINPTNDQCSLCITTN